MPRLLHQKSEPRENTVLPQGPSIKGKRKAKKIGNGRAFCRDDHFGKRKQQDCKNRVCKYSVLMKADRVCGGLHSAVECCMKPAKL